MKRIGDKNKFYKKMKYDYDDALEYIDKFYWNDLDDTTKPWEGKKLDIDLDHVDRIYYEEQGEDGTGKPWRFVIKVGRVYVYFHAYSYYSGFYYDNGGGEFVTSKNWKRFWNMGLDEYTRRKILEMKY